MISMIQRINFPILVRNLFFLNPDGITQVFGSFVVAKMSLYNHSLSLLLLLLALSVDTAPDHMLYHRDFKFYKHINMAHVIMHMNYLVKITRTVKMAAISFVFFIIIILSILFILEIRFFDYVCIDVSTIFSQNIQ